MSICVKLKHTKDNKNELNLRGYFDISNLTFTSDCGKKIKMNKSYDRCMYNERIIFMNKNEKKPQEWIFQCVFEKKIQEQLNLQPEPESEEDFECVEEESEEFQCEEDSEEMETESEYNPDESE